MAGDHGHLWVVGWVASLSTDGNHTLAADPGPLESPSGCRQSAQLFDQADLDPVRGPEPCRRAPAVPARKRR